MIKLLNIDNMSFDFQDKADLIYCDIIYENLDFQWVGKYWEFLKIGGIFIVQTDHHSVLEIGSYLKRITGSYFINHCVQKNEWGNHPKDRFHQCFDDILIFSKGTNYKFYPERVQVPKVTLTKGLNPSGRKTKQATAWIDDICLTTTSHERVKKEDGHLIKWQKPMKLFDHIVSPFTDEEELILDPFMGSESLGKWCLKHNRNYIGIEKGETIFDLAYKNIFPLEVAEEKEPTQEQYTEWFNKFD